MVNYIELGGKGSEDPRQEKSAGQEGKDNLLQTVGDAESILGEVQETLASIEGNVEEALASIEGSGLKQMKKAAASLTPPGSLPSLPTEYIRISLKNEQYEASATPRAQELLESSLWASIPRQDDRKTRVLVLGSGKAPNIFNKKDLNGLEVLFTDVVPQLAGEWPNLHPDAPNSFALFDAMNVDRMVPAAKIDACMCRNLLTGLNGEQLVEFLNSLANSNVPFFMHQFSNSSGFLVEEIVRKMNLQGRKFGIENRTELCRAMAVLLARTFSIEIIRQMVTAAMMKRGYDVVFFRHEKDVQNSREGHHIGTIPAAGMMNSLSTHPNGARRFWREQDGGSPEIVNEAQVQYVLVCAKQQEVRYEIPYGAGIIPQDQPIPPAFPEYDFQYSLLEILSFGIGNNIISWEKCNQWGDDISYEMASETRLEILKMAHNAAVKVSQSLSRRQKHRKPYKKSSTGKKNASPFLPAITIPEIDYRAMEEELYGDE